MEILVEVACYDLRYSRLLQPALFGLQEVRGKLSDSAQDRIQPNPG